MIHSRFVLMLCLVAIIGLGFSPHSACADNSNFSQKIIMFNEDVEWAVIEAYAKKWEETGRTNYGEGETLCIRTFT